jgi:hypothetical protein
MEAKKRKILVEKVEILDESTGQIILKEQARLIYSNNNDSDCEQVSIFLLIMVKQNFIYKKILN